MIRQMCGGLKEEDQGDFSYQSFDHNINMQAYQDSFVLQPDQMQDQTSIFNAGGGGLVFPHRNEASQVLPWSLPSVHDPCLVPPPPQPSAGFFNRWAYPSQPLQFGFDGQASDHLRLLSGALGPAMQPYSNPFGLQAELGRLTAQEIMDAKALAASKSHSEAERRRRERINNHFAKLRSMLPNTPKTDKASLLAEVIQHVKELKRQTSVIAESSLVPTEADELTVDAAEEDGKVLIRAALCCEDRPDLLQELIKTLKALRLKTLKAEITTLGGRVKNVLFITAEENEEVDGEEEQHYSLSSIQGALKAVMEKKSGDHHDSSSGGVKRQRTANVNIT